METFTDFTIDNSNQHIASIPRHASINLYQTRAFFEEFILPNPYAIEEWRTALKNNLTDWLHEITGREVAVITIILYDNIELPHMVTYRFLCKPGFHAILLSIYFADDTL